MSATGLSELYETKRNALQCWYDYTHSRSIHWKKYERGFDQIESSFRKSIDTYVQEFLLTKPTAQEVGLMWRAAESYSPEKELLQKEGRVLAAEWRKQWEMTQKLIHAGKLKEAHEAQQKLLGSNK